jgi:cardiolipin synthase
VSSRVLTLPNLLSFFRLLLVPVFLAAIIAGADLAALIVLVVSSVTDFFDGYLARRLNQVSRLGQLLDPAADRLYIFVALVGLVIGHVIPWWLLALVLARDLMLAVLSVVLANHGYGPLAVHHLGKVATFCLLLALPLLMLGEAYPLAAPVSLPVGWAIALWGTFLYWWAGVVYIRETSRVIQLSTSAPGGRSDTLEQEEVDGG